MASPIFISNKPATLTKDYLYLGATYYGNALARISNGIKTLHPSHMRNWIPILLLSSITYMVLAFLKTQIMKIDCRGCEYLECIIDQHMIGICIIQFCTPSFEKTFWQSLVELDPAYRVVHRQVYPMQGVGKQRTRTLQLQARVVLTQFLLVTAVAWLSRAAVQLIISSLIFRQLSYRFGTDISLFSCFVLFFFPVVKQIKFLSHFYSLHLLIRASLAPYFNKTMLQKSERHTWIQSRSGILYGYMIPFYLLILSSSHLSMLVFYLSHISGLPELIRDITDPFPDPYVPGTLQVSIWNSKQSVWSNNKFKTAEDASDLSETE